MLLLVNVPVLLGCMLALPTGNGSTAPARRAVSRIKRAVPDPSRPKVRRSKPDEDAASLIKRSYPGAEIGYCFEPSGNDFQF